MTETEIKQAPTMALPAELAALADEAEEAPGPALNKVEHAFVQRMNLVCAFLARYARDRVIPALAEELGVTEHEARRLVQKADEFLSSGVFTQAATARELYAARLQRIHDLCMSRAEEDQVEITVKPTRVIDEGGKFRMVNGQHIKTRYNVLNTGAVALAMQAAEKAAKIAGIQVDSPSSVTTFNLQINQLPGAARTSDLANRDLAHLAGLTYAGEDQLQPGAAVEEG